MSIQFRRFGSCPTDLSFDFIFQAFDFALTPLKSEFVSFKFRKKCSKFAKRSFNLAKNGDVIAQYCYSSIQIHFGAFYLTRWAFKFVYLVAPVAFINHNSVFSLVIVLMFFQQMRAFKSLILYWIIFLHKFIILIQFIFKLRPTRFVHYFLHEEASCLSCTFSLIFVYSNYNSFQKLLSFAS